jgi:dihydrofolate reductase
MAKLVYALNQSLDGYVDHMEFAPDPALFRHFIDDVRGLAGSVYGRRMYEVMRYWDEDRSEWDAEERDYAAAWRSQPKWVVSRSLTSVGPNATLVGDDIEAAIRGLKARLDGEIEVAGPELARSLTDLGLVVSIDCTSIPSCSVAASRSSPARGRRCASWPASELAGT